MAVDIKNLIAAINPDVYCENVPDKSGKKLSENVKKIVKEEGYLKAAEVAKLRASDYVDIYHVQATKGAFALEGLKNPIEQHKIVYDSYTQALEPIYFWILDYVNNTYGKAEKLVDNFVSSVGGGHFAEMQGRATRMQDEAMKIFGMANTVIRSIMNIVYDLKEFKTRLELYNNYHSKNEQTKNAALLSLKQIWMDNVDIKRGAGSLNGLAQQLDFVTIRDAFMAANSLKDVDKLDLNERVKRILKQRVDEFLFWIGESEKELRKRYSIETTYLKSQINSAKLYARWAKPYLKAARMLEQTATADANVVNAFNTAVFELVLLAEGKYDPAVDIAKGELPKSMENTKFRKYVPITLIEFRFRSIPERFDQKGGYGFRGKVDVNFTSFALNEGELKVLKEQVAEDDFGDVYEIISGATESSLGELKDDLDEFLGEGAISDTEKKKEDDFGDTNPFSALFEFAQRKEPKKDLSKGISKDNFYEKVLRSQAILGARISCRKLYNDYKKAHGMQAFAPTINF